MKNTISENPDLFVLDYIPVGMFIVTSDFTISFWNHCMEEWTGIYRKDILEHNFFERFPIFAELRYLSRLESIFNGDAPVIFSSQLHKNLFNLKLSNGEVRFLHTTVTAIPDTRNIGKYCALFSIEDVSEQTRRINDYRIIRDKMQEEIECRKQIEIELIKAKEKAEESDLLKSAFLANMSHEIRTPLNGVLGFSELLLTRNVDDDKKNEYLKIIYSSGRHLLGLINDIIDISKIESGQVHIVETECHINSIIEELYVFFSNNINEKNKTHLKLLFSHRFDDAQDGILTDDLRLKQVLTNLLDNAIKFTKDGYIEIGYTLERSKNVLRFFVKDTGIGFPAHKKDVIFQRFRQVDENINRKYGGSGLGLAICKGIVELMGGEISVESEEGKGTTFSFTIPYKPLKKEKLNTSYNDELDYDWSAKTILVVDDVEIVHFYIQQILEITNVNLLFATSGEEAIEICKSNPKIDLVLMDLQMPTMNGYEATQRIKKEYPHLPIIAQTANAFEAERTKSKEAGCDGYITKPIESTILFTTIERFLTQ